MNSKYQEMYEALMSEGSDVTKLNKQISKDHKSLLAVEKAYKKYQLNLYANEDENKAEIKKLTPIVMNLTEAIQSLGKVVNKI